MEIMNQLDGVNLHEKHGSQFHYQLFLSQAMCDASLEVLDLGVRSYHCLKRAGYDTVGDLVDALSNGVDLKSIRNCGKTSVREIQEHLFMYQYYSLKPEKRNQYLIDTVEYNLGRARADELRAV